MRIMLNKSILFSALVAFLLVTPSLRAVADDEAPAPDASPAVESADEPVEVEAGAEEAAAAAEESKKAEAVPALPEAAVAKDAKPATEPAVTEKAVAEPSAVAKSDEKTTVEKTTVEKVTVEKVVSDKSKGSKKSKTTLTKKESKKHTVKPVAKKPTPAAPLIAKARPPVVKRTGQSRPLSEFELGRYQYCGADRDCVAANNGCCDCANGGADVAVNRERLAAFQARFDCLYVSCTEKDTVPPCGSGVISCVNHKCVYFSNNTLEEKF